MLASALLSNSASGSGEAPSPSYSASTLLCCCLHDQEPKRVLLQSTWSSGGAPPGPFFAAVVHSLRDGLRGGSAAGGLAGTVARFWLLMAWVWEFPEAAEAFLADRAAFAFFLQTASSTEGTVHDQALSALLLGELCVTLSRTGSGGIVPPSPASTPTGGSGPGLSKGQVFDHFLRRLGMDQLTTRWNNLQNCVGGGFAPATPSSAGASGSGKLYGKAFVALLKSIYEATDRLVQDYVRGTVHGAEVPRRSVADPAVPSLRRHRQT